MLTSALQGCNSSNEVQLVRFSKGHAIYCEGENPSAWYAVAEGVVRTCRFTVQGARQITGFHHPGDAFGLEDDAYAETAEAVTDISLWHFPKSATAREEQQSNGWLCRALARALESAQRGIAVFGRRTAVERVAAFILMTAERAGGGPKFDFPMSRSDIGDYLGLTMHSVCRTMTQLCDGGLIALDGPQRCAILEPAGLRRLSGEAAEQSVPNQTVTYPMR